MNDFIEWQSEVLKGIDLWTTNLKNEALKQKTYKGAINYLNKSRPDLPRSYSGTASEQFQSVIRSMFDEAKKMVYDEAQSQEINHEQSN